MVPVWFLLTLSQTLFDLRSNRGLGRVTAGNAGRTSSSSRRLGAGGNGEEAGNDEGRETHVEN